MRLRVVAKEQAEPPSDLGSPPVSVSGAQGVALSVLVARRIAWNDVGNQLAQGAKQLRVRIGLESPRVALLRTLNGSMQCL